MSKKWKSNGETIKAESNAILKYNTRPLNPDRLNAILKYAGPSVIDIGCGNGSYVLHLADKFKMFGVDYKSFEQWSERPDLFMISDASSLELSDYSFDTVLSFETLEHLQDPLKALCEYRRITRKNLILTVPNCELSAGLRKSNLIYSHWSDPTHVNFFNMNSITLLVEQAGFNIRYKTYINKINLGALVMESLGVSGFLARLGARIFRIVERQPYYITCLLVAEKSLGDVQK